MQNYNLVGTVFNRIDVVGNVCLSHTYFWFNFIDFTGMILGLDQCN